ncbi:MAG: amidohydrolase family protein, partial [Actinocrinis sp.]
MNSAPEEPAPAGRDEQTVIDAHVHFWNPQHLSYPWLADAPPLNRPHTAEVLLAALPEPVEAIFVEAGASASDAEAEIAWVRSAALTHPWIRGAVANVALERPDLARPAIRRHAADPFVVGVRRNLQDEARGFTSHEHFRASVRALGDAGLPFDACVRDRQLPELTELAAACPQTTIILDHAGKPRSAHGAGNTAWRGALARLAKHDNVVCKLSGLATELPADTSRTRTADVLRAALDL